MAENLKNITTNTPSKGMTKDLNDAFVAKDMVTHARNAVTHSHQGDQFFYSTEPANLHCVDLPYFYNGSIALKDNRYFITSTDNLDSEIGIFDEHNCTYTKVVNSRCLNFHRDHPITGRSKETDTCSEVVTFTDNLNPIRRLDLSRIPYKFTTTSDACETKTFTNELDCGELNLFRNIAIPQVTLQQIPTGTLSNGAYQVAMAYFVNDQKYSDYYALTLPVHIFDQSGVGGGIAIQFNGLDQEFLQYSVVLISTIKGAEQAQQVGIFSTTQSTIIISENSRPEYLTVPLSDLVITKLNYEKAGIISGNARVLLLADLTQKPKLNYYKQAQLIDAKYVVKQVPLDYYSIGGQDIGYYRGENYRFVIRFPYTNGQFTEDTLVPGRKARGDDKSTVTGDDIYEFDPAIEVLQPKQVYKWEAYNTAQPMVLQSNPFVNNERILGTGFMGYHESTIDFPNNPLVYGADACTPLRDHQFPDEGIIPRYSTIDGQLYLNILGIQFSNITYPLDDKGVPIPGIAGYEILRCDRSGGNKTIIARGVLSNVRSYNEHVGNQTTEVLYSNYPYNDLRPDVFFSENAVINKNNNEGGYTGPSKVYYDQYNFYTPHAYFNNKYRLGREFIVESEEVGSVSGYFEPVYQHPKEKLLTNFALYFAILSGVIEGYLSLNGRKTITYQYSNADNGITDQGGALQGTGIASASILGTGVTGSVPGNTVTPSVFPTAIVSQADSVFTNLKIPKGLSPVEIAERAIVIALQALVAVGAFIYASAEFATAAIKIIMGFSGFQQYAYQYVSHSAFRAQSTKPPKGNKRRYTLQQPQYLASALQTVNNKTFNNFGKQTSVYVQFNKPLLAPTTKDTSRQTIQSFGTGSNPTQKVSSVSAMYYATSKTSVPDQYGQVESTPRVKTTDSFISFTNQNTSATSPVIFGGDCIIAPFSVLTKQPIFQQHIAGANFQDGTEYNYGLYRNIAHPRFWMDSTFWTMGDLITKTPALTNLPSSKYNLDGRGNSNSTTDWVVTDRYFYLYINGVLDFIVEADYNISFRQEVIGKPFYSKNSSNLTEIFRSDRITQPEQFVLDQSYYKLQANEIFSQPLPLDFNPTSDAHCKVHNRNSVIYSLPSFVGTKVDNWQYFLPANFFTFDQNDFGNLTTVKQLDQTRMIFLFDRSSPYISYGQDELETTDGRKITIGDAGLFARPPRELQHTDVSYGNSKSRYATVSTQYGLFYPSYSQGRIFNLTGQFEEIQQLGMHYWCQEYMLFQLHKAFPTYPQAENPFFRVGYLTFFDSSSKTVYITKRDYAPNANIKGITYNATLDKFFFNSTEIFLQDTNYFTDVSWTLSYSPDPQSRGFISFHDWSPDGVIQTENHFVTIKGKSLWKHNERCDLYCNFYNTDYPFEIEISASTGQQTHILDSLEYILEGYTFKNNCRDRFQLPYANFDKLIVWNSEQVSALLTPVLEKESPYENQNYPLFNGSGYDILFSRHEQKIRIAQFEDLTRDRGEITGNQIPLFFSHPSGYKRIINPAALNYTKDAEQRKSFRHYTNRVWFSLSKPGPIKLLCKFFNLKITRSPR